MRACVVAALLALAALAGEAAAQTNGTAHRSLLARSRDYHDGDGERLIGWKGEKKRPQLRATGNRGGKGSVSLAPHGIPSVPRTVGEKFHLEDLERGTWVEMISWRPRAFIIHNFMSHEECDQLIDIARPFIARSTVIDSATGEPVVDDIRTSSQTFLDRLKYPLVTELEARGPASAPKRLTRFTYLPWENGEDLQILRYGVGEKYDAHHDVGELDSVSGKQLASDGGYRVATSLWYLVDTEEGGETAFPDSEWADPKLSEGEWSTCAKGRVASRAKKGEALVFFSITPGNEIDPASMHAGCPVIKGIKWTATKWIHADAFRWQNIRPKDGPAECVDNNPQCHSWAEKGECVNNKPFMVGTASQPGSCLKSCHACKPEI